MQAAFIGNESKISTYSSILKKAITASECKALNICGVMSAGIEATTNLAIMLNTKAYLSLDDLLREADIIFVCRQDNQLAPFSDLMKEKRVRGKVFCHFSSKHDSSILSCGSTNTYYSVGFPYPTINGVNPRNLTISLEGDGKHSDQFEAIMKSIFPKAVFCTKSEKRMYVIASRIVTEYMKIIVKVSMHFFKMSGLYDEESFADFFTRSLKDIITSNASKKIRKRSENEIRQDLRLLSVIHYGDTKDFYKNMETHIAETGIYTPDEKESILRTLKRKA